MRADSMKTMRGHTTDAGRHKDAPNAGRHAGRKTKINQQPESTARIPINQGEKDANQEIQQ